MHEVNEAGRAPDLPHSTAASRVLSRALEGSGEERGYGGKGSELAGSVFSGMFT
jgi:hypothetical protein